MKVAMSRGVVQGRGGRVVAREVVGVGTSSNKTSRSWGMAGV
jgi:hypothetical protein